MLTKTQATGKIINALCFDIDDLTYSLRMKNGGGPVSDYLVERESYGLLEFLERLQVRATMFVPGYVAECSPGLVKAMAAAGHGIGSHGYRHIHAGALQRNGFRNDIVESKIILEDIIGKPVHAYKDPCWGITAQTPWAYDELIEAGYTLDNTAQPSFLRSIGHSPQEMLPFRYKGLLTVIPVTSFRVFEKSLPLNGGLFCAYIPIAIQIRYYRNLNKKGIPFNYFCHPYELNPEGANRNIWKHKSITASLYGMYFGRYRRYISRLAAYFRLGPLEEAYKDHIIGITPLTDIDVHAAVVRPAVLPDFCDFPVMQGSLQGNVNETFIPSGEL